MTKIVTNLAKRNIKCILTILIILVNSFASAEMQGGEWAKKVPVGSEFPIVNAIDQWGDNWSNQKPPGKNGYVFFFNRSATW